MDNYTKLKANFPTFGATLQLDERQVKSLHDLLAYTEGSLTSYRSEVAKADALYSQYNEKIRDQKRSEALSTAKQKSLGSIEAEFEKVQGRVPKAQTALYNATHLPKPEDSAGELLRFMQQKEIRDGLEKMLLAKRFEVLQKACQDGLGEVLWAVESQPIISDLVPKDVMERSAGTLGAKMAPEQFALVQLAMDDLEGATAVKNLASVEIGRIENG